MSAELEELRRQKRTEARRKRVEQKREQRREAERNATALVVLALTMPATDCLRSFLQRSGAGELSAPETEEAVASTVDALLAMTTAQTVCLLEPSDAQQKGRLRRATTFSIEHGVHTWVAEKNTGCGVAPVVSSVVARRQALAEEHREQGRAVGAPSTKWGYYKWVARWRRRWRVQRARAHPRDVLDAAAVRQKALVGRKRNDRDGDRARGWCPNGGQKRAPVAGLAKKWDRKTVPLFYTAVM